MVLTGEVIGGSGELVLAGLPGDVADLVGQWLIAHAGAPEDLAPPTPDQHTYRRYRYVAGQWLAHCMLRGINPLDPGRAAIDAWMGLLAATPSARTGRTPSKATLANTLSVLGSFYLFLLDEEEIDSVPIRRRNRPQVSKESQTVGLSAAEVAAFEETLLRHASVLERAILLTLLWQGLRISELLNMRVGALGYGADGVRTMTVHGKGGKVRTIPVDPAAGAAIDALLAERFSDDDPPPDALLFTTTSVPLTRISICRDLQRLARAAGILSYAKLSPHSLRHTCATMLLDGGAPLHVVQSFLGHSSPETTIRYDRARGALNRAVDAQAGARRHVAANHRPHPPGVSP